jgi:hypothetical protein
VKRPDRAPIGHSRVVQPLNTPYPDPERESARRKRTNRRAACKPRECRRGGVLCLLVLSTSPSCEQPVATYGVPREWATPTRRNDPVLIHRAVPAFQVPDFRTIGRETTRRNGGRRVVSVHRQQGHSGRPDCVRRVLPGECAVEPSRSSITRSSRGRRRPPTSPGRVRVRRVARPRSRLSSAAVDGEPLGSTPMNRIPGGAQP